MGADDLLYDKEASPSPACFAPSFACELQWVECFLGCLMTSLGGYEKVIDCILRGENNDVNAWAFLAWVLHGKSANVWRRSLAFRTKSIYGGGVCDFVLSFTPLL
jgi:hypothetical protein